MSVGQCPVSRFLLLAVLVLVLQPNVQGEQEHSSSQTIEQLPVSKRHLIMGYANGLQLAEIGTFLLSARRFMPRAHVVLFMDPTTTDAAIVRRLGVEVKDSDSMRVSFLCYFKTKWTGQRKCIEPHLHRHWLTSSYLRQHPSRFRLVLACDVRDTAFQANIFAVPAVHALAHHRAVMVADENPPPNAGYHKNLTILEQPANRGWLKDCFGEDVWPKVDGKPIVCSGWMVGEPAAVQKLAQDIVDTFKQKCPVAPQHGLDQGILNWLVYIDTRQRDYTLQVVPNGLFVFHVHVTTAELHHGLYLNNIYQVINNMTGQPFPAVHQYDRLAPLKASFRAMYPISNNSWQEVH